MVIHYFVYFMDGHSDALKMISDFLMINHDISP